jgi:acetyl-CoA carboxylase carboxyl transferase subunit beta
MKSLAEFLAAKRLHDSEQAVLPDSGTCINCGTDLAESKLYQEFRVCDQCRFHYSIGAHRRVELLVDDGTFRESNRSLISVDPIHFSAPTGFKRRIQDEQRRTGLADAIVTGTGRIAGRKVVIAAVDFRFLGGSVGCAVGEKLARALEQGARNKLPVLTIIASGGVRMQEGLLALMQFAKVAQAAGRLAASGQPHIAVLANPCLGGAYAVFANLADLIVAEPGALIGYASTRVVEEDAGRQTPEGSRLAESLQARGLIDHIVERVRLRDFLSSLLEMIAARPDESGKDEPRLPDYPSLPHSAWTTIQLARHSERPTATDYIAHFSDTFVELRGDRVAGDDRAVVCGLGMLGADPVVYVGLQRDRAGHGAATVRPEGFRKAKRAFDLAGRLHLPIVTLIDGVVASPTIKSEESGLGPALTSCMTALSAAPTASVGTVIGEARGESALALSLTDRLLMLDNAAFEVISPETAASIIYRDSGMADTVATSLRPTAKDCRALGIVDTIVPEPAAGAHSDHEAAARLLSAALLRTLGELRGTPHRKLVQSRYDRYRRVGQYTNYLRETVGRDVAQLGGDIARKAGGALVRLARRPRSRSAEESQPAEDPGSLLVP